MALKDIFRFQTLLDLFRRVDRVILVKDTERYENDVEHSYMLAMLAWYIVSSERLDLDKDKLIRYALIHDLVEVYAGDTYLYDQDMNMHASKKEREEQAAERLKKEFPEFLDLHETIHTYESRGDRESKFVYALDKVQPVLNVYLDQGRTWQKFDITLAMLREKKDERIKVSPEVNALWEELRALLAEREQELFQKK